MEIVGLSQYPISEVINKAVLVLLDGGLIVYPTETCYGLGVDAGNDEAVDKLWNFKGERGNKPVLVAVSSLKMAKKYVEVNEKFLRIANKHWPGPVSLVAKSKNNVSIKVQGGKDNLGIRMPDMELVLSIVKKMNKAITSTSANISGGENPYSLEKFLADTPTERQAMVDLFIDFGEIPQRKPSTIVDVSGNKAMILRQGEVEIKC